MQVRLSNEDCTIETDMTGVADPSVEFHFGKKKCLSVIVGIPSLSECVSCCASAFCVALLNCLHVFSSWIVATVAIDDGDQLSLSTADFKWQDIAVRLNQRRSLSKFGDPCMQITRAHECARTIVVGGKKLSMMKQRRWTQTLQNSIKRRKT